VKWFEQRYSEAAWDSFIAGLYATGTPASQIKKPFRAQAAEAQIQANINAEAQARQAADEQLQQYIEAAAQATTVADDELRDVLLYMVLRGTRVVRGDYSFIPRLRVTRGRDKIRSVYLPGFLPVLFRGNDPVSRILFQVDLDIAIVGALAHSDSVLCFWPCHDNSIQRKYKF
jgi:hypothetical protein